MICGRGRFAVALIAIIIMSGKIGCNGQKGERERLLSSIHNQIIGG
mgnify:CR=1 FL=1